MIWKEVFGHQNYEICENGELRNKRTQSPVKQFIEDGRYSKTRIQTNGKKYTRYIGRMVWETFNDCRCEETINHIDSNKQNNHIFNLECISYRDNILKRNKIIINPPSIETKSQIVKEYRSGKSMRSISKKYGITTNYLTIVFKRGTWNKHVDGPKKVQ